jgi:hypothetical protein
MWYGVKFE